MLVDNTIDGDSRVQKRARAMAEAGWEAHLLGKAPATGGDEYLIGPARALRIPLKHLVARKTLRLRLHRLRYPLAYAAKNRIEFKQNQIAVATAELLVGSIGDAARTGISASALPDAGCRTGCRGWRPRPVVRGSPHGPSRPRPRSMPG
ncbi:hypothetical protein ACFWMX_02355 [Streptomyces sp. NPDC058378]|uniref:hypothetical protein n=1 Tax=unclassified Streptomyces TaxID=2593676 RepID=UPI00366A3660